MKTGGVSSKKIMGKGEKPKEGESSVLRTNTARKVDGLLKRSRRRNSVKGSLQRFRHQSELKTEWYAAGFPLGVGEDVSYCSCAVVSGTGRKRTDRSGSGERQSIGEMSGKGESERHGEHAYGA